MSSSSNTLKLSGSNTANNVKTILKPNNIYPGINPQTKIQNELSSLNFVRLFPDIQGWLTSKNLEQFVKDPLGDKIPFITAAKIITDTLEENITIQTYNSLKQQKLQSHRDAFRSNWVNEIYNVHQQLNIRYPPETIAIIPNKDLKALARKYNATASNLNYPMEEITFGDPRVEALILRNFNSSYSHWADAVPNEV